MSLNSVYPNELRDNCLKWSLAVSVGLHLAVLFIIAAHKLSSKSLAPSQNSPIEISEITPQMLAELKKQIRQQVPLPKENEIAESEKSDNNEVDPKARFLSDKNQTVDQQTRAKKIDNFQKHEGTGPKGKSQGSQKDSLALRETGVMDSGATSSEPDLPTQKKNWRQLSLKDLGVGGDGGLSGASDDRLQGVQEGERTILSTREYKYFSYYHRIKELLRQYWKPMVEQKIFMLVAKGRNLGENEVTTKLLVLLTEAGEIAKISRMSTSGVEELDEAAMEAFQKAGPFPNPPNGIVDPDGFVRIRWDFILKTEAAPRIQFSGIGRGNSRNAP